MLPCMCSLLIGSHPLFNLTAIIARIHHKFLIKFIKILGSITLFSVVKHILLAADNTSLLWQIMSGCHYLHISHHIWIYLLPSHKLPHLFLSNPRSGNMRSQCPKPELFRSGCLCVPLNSSASQGG